MKEHLINDIIQKMASVLDNAQMEHLQKTLEYVFFDVEVIQCAQGFTEENELCFQELFISAKDAESEFSSGFYTVMNNSG